MEAKFNIGHQLMSGGKHSRLYTVVDIHKTYNSKGELFKLRYVAECDFMGQKLRDNEICETTLLRAGAKAEGRSA